MTVGLVSVPEDADADNVRVMLSCTNPEWAQHDPHKAMQVHIECEVGVCVTKTIAYLTLQRQGKLVPDSSRA
ncbi:hypothetical protein IU501_11015 [Nocardia otitidiscaviarum]|uniref:hypothetical protein n=1 Tax=Nocardia otitidiscaviarum TaxID=1823 RepID=UPI0018962905|nr:hypothetical protein [Nocardia otitidiscaviarum]MBF6133530.1 hypothetical protein [Nocardia otitidiscaviarum]